MGLTLHEFDHLDPVERDYWVADWQLGRRECPQCGGPRADCEDSDRKWFPQRTVCYPTMESQAAQARYADRHEGAPFHDGTFGEWNAKRTRAFPYHYNEGVTVWVSPHDLSPDDPFLGGSAPTDEDHNAGDD